MKIFNHKPKTNVDPQDLLPSDIRDRWAVVPRFELYQLFVAGFLFGAGAAASILGFTVGPTYLSYGFPVALVLCFLQASILGRFADGLLRELGESRGGVTPNKPLQPTSGGRDVGEDDRIEDAARG
jgi:hypothetical protein